MEIDNFGRVIVSEKEAFESIYSGNLHYHKLFLEENKVIQFNKAINQNKDHLPILSVLKEEDIALFDESNQCDWFMPKNYCTNLITDLYELCQTEEQKTRVDNELTLFIQHGMFDLLFYLKYLVDTMRQHNIVWGVGRGSSVASYVLYLIGIHKIDSLKYDLNINEFLKET